MKRLKLKELKLNPSQILNRKQLKNVLGGSGTDTCTASCSGGSPVTCSGDNYCTATDNIGCYGKTGSTEDKKYCS